MIGLVVNPVAGVGGPAGLAGSDGADVQRLAASRGAHSRAQERATIALRVLASRHPSLVVGTAAGAMGADAVRAAGLEPWVVYAASEASCPSPETGGSSEAGDSSVDRPVLDDPPVLGRGLTQASDTSAAVAALAAAGVTLILVAGGDGTLRDAVAGLADLAATTPEKHPDSGSQRRSAVDSGTHLRSSVPPPAVLGIPSGVKMYSPVFAVSPRAAGALAAEWIDGALPTAEREVLDVDEQAMRHARVEPVLYGMLRVPFRVGRTQSRKAATPASEADAVVAAARGVVKRMLPGTRYLLGPGSTTAEVARQLGIRKSPLGVDVVLDGQRVLTSASEEQLLAEVALGPAQAVVTVIGGQGFLLGRGNQQLSASVIRALGDDPLLVVAPEQKLIDLHGRPLIVETGDAELDARLAGHIRIVTGPGTSSLYAVAAPDLAL
ncbi:ATP-NAD kinase family protein [Microbacterium arabinogalactanolyticum]|uniref:ATP-NAD kinase n=1 Tax=Microbacterium arabinogalactanolyticum TaxID=69365 RepID=A0ABQ5NCM7_9MICO|nr:NAD(+)/NADH kinase [Microbacterium arabinogalactanolyticum]GLC83425.1 ATP-NAD kinase [Microbacterium arabinogalactanolyticum]